MQSVVNFISNIKPRSHLEVDELVEQELNGESPLDQKFNILSQLATTDDLRVKAYAYRTLCNVSFRSEFNDKTEELTILSQNTIDKELSSTHHPSKYLALLNSNLVLSNFYCGNVIMFRYLLALMDIETHKLMDDNNYIVSSTAVLSYILSKSYYDEDKFSQKAVYYLSNFEVVKKLPQITQLFLISALQKLNSSCLTDLFKDQLMALVIQSNNQIALNSIQLLLNFFLRNHQNKTASIQILLKRLFHLRQFDYCYTISIFTHVLENCRLFDLPMFLECYKLAIDDNYELTLLALNYLIKSFYITQNNELIVLLVSALEDFVHISKHEELKKVAFLVLLDIVEPSKVKNIIHSFFVCRKEWDKTFITKFLQLTTVKLSNEDIHSLLVDLANEEPDSEKFQCLVLATALLVKNQNSSMVKRYIENKMSCEELFEQTVLFNLLHDRHKEEDFLDFINKLEQVDACSNFIHYFKYEYTNLVKSDKNFNADLDALLLLNHEINKTNMLFRIDHTDNLVVNKYIEEILTENDNAVDNKNKCSTVTHNHIDLEQEFKNFLDF